MLSPRALRTLSELGYAALVLTTFCLFGLSCVALLSQAVRTSPTQSWAKNYDVLVIGIAYVVVVRFPLRYDELLGFSYVPSW